MSDDKSKIAWIDTIPEDEASGELARAYQRGGDQRTGNVDGFRGQVSAFSFCFS